MQSAIADIETLIYYAKKFQRLRVDRAHGVAPHKPILLLSVIESFAKGRITENRIELSELLNQTFLKNWSYLGSPCHHPDIARPFFHMKSGKFWHLYANPGFEKVLAAKIKLKTLAEVKQAISHAYLDEDLFDFLLDASIRKSLLAVLVGAMVSGKAGRGKENFTDPMNFKSRLSIFWKPTLCIWKGSRKLSPRCPLWLDDA